MFGYGCKRDENEGEVVDALHSIGIEVAKISGPGFADLVTFDPQRGLWLPVEVKTEHGTLKPLQIKMRARMPYPVVQNAGEACALFMGGREWPRKKP